jgi:hypothetical protein
MKAFRAFVPVAVSLSALALFGCGPSSNGGADASRAADAGNDCACASGVCLSDGGCGHCTLDTDCQDADRSRCDTSDNVCVACLPGATDNCSLRHYCDASSLTCLQGCKSGSDCQSDQCDSDHDCVGCAEDAECALPNVCQESTCGPPCGPSSPCSDTALTCCAPHCSDLQADIANCGACNNSCGPNQFCDSVSCEDVAFSQVCANPFATVLLDAQSADNDASAIIAAALSDGGCTLAPTVSFVQQATAAGILDPATNQPIVGGGRLLVASGGPYVQNVVAFLEAGESPVHYMSTSTTVSFVLRDGGVVVNEPSASLDAGNDYFLLELVREWTNGSLTLVCYGMLGPGTPAGARFFAGEVMPQVMSQPGSWYVVHWTSVAGADVFSVVAQGP